MTHPLRSAAMTLGLVLLAHCGGSVHEQGTAELGPACDTKKAETCPTKNDCQLCVFAGGGLCGFACKQAGDCGAGLSCRKTHNYSYTGPCTKWSEDVGYCAPLRDPIGSLCAVVSDCEIDLKGCAICGQATGDDKYRCRRPCSVGTDCPSGQKCVSPAATSAYTSLAACEKPEKYCE